MKNNVYYWKLRGSGSGSGWVMEGEVVYEKQSRPGCDKCFLLIRNPKLVTFLTDWLVLSYIYIYIQPTVYITFSFDWCEYWLWLEASHITLAYAQLRAVHFHMSLIRFYIIFSLSKLNYLSCFLFSLLLFPFRHVPLGENYWKYLPN